MDKKGEYFLSGAMSGSSMDGLDLAYAGFSWLERENKWQGSILKAETFEYSEKWKKKLIESSSYNSIELLKIHSEFGQYCGEMSAVFHRELKIRPMALAFHGHTVFHQPGNFISFQLGHGSFVAESSGLSVISDFRMADIAAGGQGAPLVPAGDYLLFNEYDACLNIGGIANVSYHINKGKGAFDICIANQLLNYLAEQAGSSYDAGGQMAREGSLNTEILEKAEGLPYYNIRGNKSLGREWFDQELKPLFSDTEIPLKDKLNTAVEHLSKRIAGAIQQTGAKKILVTGGGAYNDYLIERIKFFYSGELIIPDDLTVQFKEAYVFAFLGLLYLKGADNSFPDTTGAQYAVSGGCLYAPKFRNFTINKI